MRRSEALPVLNNAVSLLVSWVCKRRAFLRVNAKESLHDPQRHRAAPLSMANSTHRTGHEMSLAWTKKALVSEGEDTAQPGIAWHVLLERHVYAKLYCTQQALQTNVLRAS